MLRLPRVLAAAALAAMPLASVHAQGTLTADVTAETLAERVDGLFTEYDRPGSPGVAVGVVRDGQLVYARGYGEANLEYGVPITPQTVFHVASVSKQFTAFAAALLAEQGRMSLDDDVRRHVPEVPDFGHTITVRHLIHHTSGLRDQWELLALSGWRLDDVITQDHVFRLLRNQRELNFEPGSAYMYSNMGYTLLAEIVSRVAGEPFPAWMEANVFRPLGMASTHFHLDHERLVPGRAYSYAPLADGGYRHRVLSYANVGATSLFTTVEDLARWIGNLENPSVGSPALVAGMKARGVLTGGDTIPYAFALIHDTHRAAPVVQHGGADAGYRAILAYFPGERLGLVALSNVSTFNGLRTYRELADAVLGDALGPVDPPPATPATPAATAHTPATLAPYVGRYHSPELGLYFVVEPSEEEEGLTLVHPRHPDSGLRPLAADTFGVVATGPGLWGNGYFRLAFERDEAGEITGFRVNSGRIRHLWFRRTE